MKVANTSTLARFTPIVVLGAVLGFVMFAGTTTPATSATEINQDKFDVDTYPAINVSHRVPTVLVSDETAVLQFTFACGYFTPGEACEPDATLYVSFGTTFKPTDLAEEDIDSLRMLTARVPAVDREGGYLQYYLEVVDKARDVSVRFPTAGYLEPYVSSLPVDVRLSGAVRVSGDVVHDMAWGSGKFEAGLDAGPERSAIGPYALDVSPSGDTIAILDGMNERALVTSVAADSAIEFPIQARIGDIAVGDSGDIMVLDSIGVSTVGGPPQPQLHVYDRDGLPLRHATWYGTAASSLTDDGQVIGIDSRTVAPITAAGASRSRADQRATAAGSDLEIFFRHDGSVLLADRIADVAFRLTANDGVGPVALFEKYANGYIVAMESDTGVRLIWLNPQGTVLGYVEAPSFQWADASPTGRIAADDAGRVYLLNSTESGIEILRIEEEQK